MTTQRIQFVFALALSAVAFGLTSSCSNDSAIKVHQAKPAESSALVNDEAQPELPATTRDPVQPADSNQKCQKPQADPSAKAAPAAPPKPPQPTLITDEHPMLKELGHVAGWTFLRWARELPNRPKEALLAIEKFGLEHPAVVTTVISALSLFDSRSHAKALLTRHPEHAVRGLGLAFSAEASPLRPAEVPSDSLGKWLMAEIRYAFTGEVEQTWHDRMQRAALEVLADIREARSAPNPLLAKAYEHAVTHATEPVRPQAVSGLVSLCTEPDVSAAKFLHVIADEVQSSHVPDLIRVATKPGPHPASLFPCIMRFLDTDQRTAILSLVESLGPKAASAVDALVASLHLKPDAAVIRALGSVGAAALKRAAPTLKLGLRDRDAEYSYACHWALKNMGVSHAFPSPDERAWQLSETEWQHRLGSPMFAQARMASFARGAKHRSLVRFHAGLSQHRLGNYHCAYCDLRVLSSLHRRACTTESDPGRSFSGIVLTSDAVASARTTERRTIERPRRAYERSPQKLKVTVCKRCNCAIGEPRDYGLMAFEGALTFKPTIADECFVGSFSERDVHLAGEPLPPTRRFSLKLELVFTDRATGAFSGVLTVTDNSHDEKATIIVAGSRTSAGLQWTAANGDPATSACLGFLPKRIACSGRFRDGSNAIKLTGSTSLRGTIPWTPRVPITLAVNTRRPTAAQRNK